MLLSPQGQNRNNKHGFYNARVSLENNKWILSLAMDVQEEKPKLNYYVGVDLGVKTLATISCNGEKSTILNINKSKEVKRLEKRLRREQRQAARRIKKSSNQIKAYKQINKTYTRLRNIRRNHNHKATFKIISMLPLAIGIEDLNISGMLKNKHLAKAIQDCSFYEILRQLEYKAAFKGIKIIKADRFYPSTKRCSRCGHIHGSLTLKDRTYKCNKCNLTIDRDFNASLNLEKLASTLSLQGN